MTRMRKLLRSSGIALLALPEPFTTPLGALLLCAAYSLPRRPRADSYSRLQEFGKLYLSLYRNQIRSFDIGGQSGTPEKIVHHALGYNPPNAPLIPVIPEKIIHHTLRCDWQTQPVTPEKIIHHTLIYTPPSAPLIPVIPEKIIHHTLVDTIRYDWHSQPVTPEEIIHHTLNRRLATRYSGIAGVFASVR